ncbi:MAG: hypothetical protein C4523_15275 [Myxococcales bacterium]|nr:MAG: hypothetical protein C4523_15275 [Myxococcales bacterium]
MQKHLFFSVILVLLFAGAAFAGCGGGGDDEPAPTDGDTDGDLPQEDGDEESGDGDVEEEPPGVNENVEAGMMWLEKGEATFANASFKLAFEEDPDDPQARFGYAFTESLVSFEILGMLITTVSSVTGSSDWPQPEEARTMSVDPPPPDGYESWDDWLDKEIYFAFDLINSRFKHSVELYGPLKEEGGLSMRFEKLPIYIGLFEPTYIRGEIDDADVFMFDAMSRTFAALFQMVLSHHLKSDLATIISRYQGGTLGDTQDTGNLGGVMTYLLNYEPKFLDFRDNGRALVSESSEYLFGALQDILDAAVAAEAEQEEDSDQSDEFFVVEKERDESDLVMQVWITDVNGPGEKLQAVTLITPTELVAVSTWKNQLENGGPAAPMDEVVMPILASMAIMPIAFGLLDAFGFDLGLDPQIITPSLLATLVTSFVDLDLIAIDLHAYLQDPKPLREMLPVWSTDKPGFENTMMMEWECAPEEMVDGHPIEGFSCKTEETMVDAPHFVGTAYEIAADGKTFTSPYTAYQDPTFGGILYVNVPKLEAQGYPASPEWRAADQFLINLLMGTLGQSASNLPGGGR